MERLSALKAGNRMDFFGNAGPKCPHCGVEFNVIEQEWYRLYDDNEDHDVECPRCEDQFMVRTHATYSFSTDEQED